ncbi:MAG: MarR family winged helix-turn-helix transcriptional regulator [Desulfomonilaceae bacterium]|nr:MarR family winged helix-turn-helix transcriptional regulator [Desulfomonilaceae bacterium]
MNAEHKQRDNEVGRTCACFNLRRAARLVTQRFDEAFRELGLRATQLSVLTAVYHVSNPPLSKLAGTLGMDRTSLTRNLQVLQRKGLIVVKEGDDKRQRRICITPEGERVLASAFPIWRKVQTEVEEAIGAEKWDGLLTGLHEVARKFR